MALSSTSVTVQSEILDEPAEADAQGVQVAPELLDGLGDAVQAPREQILVRFIALQVFAQRGGDHPAHRLRTRRGVRSELLKEVAR